jgi:hypothetical protein
VAPCVSEAAAFNAGFASPGLGSGCFELALAPKWVQRLRLTHHRFKLAVSWTPRGPNERTQRLFVVPVCIESSCFDLPLHPSCPPLDLQTRLLAACPEPQAC